MSKIKKIKHLQNKKSSVNSLFLRSTSVKDVPTNIKQRGTSTRRSPQNVGHDEMILSL